jgi:hypothetical protein
VRANWKALGIPALAAVAALTIWLFIPRSGRLPTYELELPGGVGHAASVGAAESTATRLEREPGLGLTLLLRPNAAPSVPIEVRTFVANGAAPDASATPLQARTEPAGSDAIRLSLGSASLPAAGRLIVLVGREGALPSSPSTGSASHGHGWQRFDIAFAPPGKER